jgi:ferredoxin/flavodoxin---NADP+ reductase
MANVSVITDACTKDMKCIAVCQRKAIHPREDEPGHADVKQLFVNPKKCIDCGSCRAICEAHAIFAKIDLPPDKAHFAELNAAYYKKS